MSLAVCAFISWLVIIILSIIPKMLSETDMVFLYFSNVIFEVSIFTLMHINLNWIEVNSSVGKSLADLIIRFVMFPLLFLIMSNVMMYPWKFMKWMSAVGFALTFILINVLLGWLGINKLLHWNLVDTLAMFCAYALFSQAMALGMIRVDKEM